MEKPLLALLPLLDSILSWALQGPISMFLKFLSIFKVSFFFFLSVSSGIFPIIYPDLHLCLYFTPKCSPLIKHSHPPVFTCKCILFFLVSEYEMFLSIRSSLLLGQYLPGPLVHAFQSLQIPNSIGHLLPFCASKININMWLKMLHSVKYI